MRGWREGMFYPLPSKPVIAAGSQFVCWRLGNTNGESWEKEAENAAGSGVPCAEKMLLGPVGVSPLGAGSGDVYPDLSTHLTY